MRIHLIRHTTPDISSELCYGQSDLSLADSFAQECDKVHAKLDQPYDAIYSSPLQRCSLLADTIDATHRAIEPRLMEYDFGDWELKPWSEFNSKEAQNWMNNFVDHPAPNGESMLSMQARVLDFWQELVELDYQSVALVTHSGVQRLIHGHILGTPLSHLFRLQLSFGAVLEVIHHQHTGLQTIRHR